MSPARSFPGFPAGAIGALLAVAILTGEEPARLTVAAGEGEKAIHAALARLPATGGIVELGAGTFSLTQPVFLDHDGVELRGQGADTRLVLAAKANCPAVVIGRPGGRPDRVVRRVTVRSLFIDGNRTAQEFECWGGPCGEENHTDIRNNALTVRGAEGILIEDVTVCRARSGGVVLEKYCRRVRINRLEAFANEFDGVAAYDTEESEFTGLRLHHNRSAGFSFDWRFNRNRVADSVAADNGSQGIFMRDAIGNSFERMTLSGNGEQGIFMAETRSLPGTACRYNRFTGVTITGNRTQGIRINDRSCNPNTIEDSLVKDNRLEDISLADFGQLEIIRPR